jgi:hypothetical protein
MSEQLANKHIVRLQTDIAERQQTIKRHNLGKDGFEAALNRDDAKKIALLREGLVPKYSDLPAGGVLGENNLPKIEMFEFADLMDETRAAKHDLELIDYGKTQVK